MSRGLRSTLALVIIAACGKTSIGGGPLDSDAGGGVPAFEVGGQATTVPPTSTTDAGQPTTVGGEPSTGGVPGVGGVGGGYGGGAPNEAGAAGRADAGSGQGGASGSEDCSTFEVGWALNHCEAFANGTPSCSGLCREDYAMCGPNCPDCSACELDCEACRRAYVACRARCNKAQAACVKFDCPAWQEHCSELADQYPACVAR